MTMEQGRGVVILQVEKLSPSPPLSWLYLQSCEHVYLSYSPSPTVWRAFTRLFQTLCSSLYSQHLAQCLAQVIDKLRCMLNEHEFIDRGDWAIWREALHEPGILKRSLMFQGAVGLFLSGLAWNQVQ